jgi:hypothetical protein
MEQAETERIVHPVQERGSFRTCCLLPVNLLRIAILYVLNVSFATSKAARVIITPHRVSIAGEREKSLFRARIVCIDHSTADY